MADSLKDFMESGQQEEDRIFKDGEDFYRLYLEELDGVAPCTPEEEEALLAAVASGNRDAAGRLVEGNLRQAVRMAEEYKDRGVSLNDLVQEANMALLLAAQEYREGDFKSQMEACIRSALLAALKSQDTELKIEEEMAARVNVLKDISSSMAEELGREATVEELAGRMKMTEEEIKDIMKLTLDAMSVSGE